MNEKEEGYARAIDQMAEAGRRWVAAHPFAEPRFRFDAFEEETIDRARAGGQTLPAGKAAIVALLSDVVDQVGANADGRALLRAMVDATGDEATYLQARALIEHVQQRSAEKLVHQGQLTEPGDWHCPCCAAKLDGFTKVGDKPARPKPGDFTICGYCLAILSVAETGDRYDARSLEALKTEMPADAYKQMMKMRELIRQLSKQRDERAKRS